MPSPPMSGLPLRGYQLAMARTAWVALVVLVLVLFVTGIAARYNQLLSLSPATDRALLQLNPEEGRALRQLGLSQNLYAAYLTLLETIFTTVFAIIGGVIFRRSNDGWVMFVAFTLVIVGATLTPIMDTLATARPAWRLPITYLQLLGPGCLLIFLYLFPDGRFVPRWTRWLAIGWAVWLVTVPLLPERPSVTPGVNQQDVMTLGWIATGVLAQIYRYRRVSNSIQRQQSKRTVLGLAIAVMAGLLHLLLLALAPPGLSNVLLNLIFAPIFVFSLLVVPLSIAFSILRYRLWDIEVVIQRAVIYGALTGAVILVYVIIVGGLSVVFQVRGNLFVSLLATGLIALMFQPLRERLQRAVNRLLYGDRDDPYAVLSRLGRQLEATLAPEAVLPALVETISQTLKLPYVAIALQPANGSEPEIATAYGLPTGSAVRLPLTYQSEHVGELLIAPRAPDEAFTPAEHRLLTDIAHQAGVAVHAMRLTADLQRSRERLVTAREEERRRIRRDLHDGLGPALAIHSLKVGSARSLLTRHLPMLSNMGSVGQDIATADSGLAELERDIASALTDIRRLVYDLRPPTLDELGLVAAIRESAARYAPTTTHNPDTLRITVDAPERLSPLPAAVEVAAFRITQEALTNVVRYAQARTCLIRLTLEDGLWVEVTDDGVGLSATRNEHRAGVGLASIRERADELGGTCVIESPPTGGTRVRARLPLG